MQSLIRNEPNCFYFEKPLTSLFLQVIKTSFLKPSVTEALNAVLNCCKKFTEMIQAMKNCFSMEHISFVNTFFKCKCRRIVPASFCLKYDVTCRRGRRGGAAGDASPPPELKRC